MGQEKLDLDEVRRALDYYGHIQPVLGNLGVGHLVAAAREWLSLRERHQPCHEAPYHPEVLRFDKNFTQSWDAAKWAQAFRSTARSLGYCDMDEGWLIGWFANAIMRGYDERVRLEEERKGMNKSPVPSEAPLTVEAVRERIADLEAIEASPDNALTPVGRLDLQIARECFRLMTSAAQTSGPEQLANGPKLDRARINSAYRYWTDLLDNIDGPVLNTELLIILPAVREWLLQQEQRELPHAPTLDLIDQVLDACSANYPTNELTVHRYGKSLYEVTCHGGGKEQRVTLQEALQKVYDNAVLDLKLRHQRDAESLARLDGKLPD